MTGQIRAIVGRMDTKPDPRPTTPEEEGVEFYPDDRERFERAFDRVVKAPPAHRTGKQAAADQPRKRGVRHRAKSSG